MLKRLRLRVSVVGLCLVTLTTGCSNSQAPETPEIETTAVPETTRDPETTEESDYGQDTADPAPLGTANALELTGHAEAGTVPDMEPVLNGLTPELPTTLVDATGNEVTVTSADRILSLDLYGTLTDTLIGLDLHDRLVGRANSDTQDTLEDLPVVTRGGHDLNIEAVLELQPDLVITNTTIGSEELYDQLEGTGVTVVRFEQTPSINNITTEIEMVGETFGLTSQAQELAEHTEARLAEVREQIEQMTSQTPRAPRGLVLYIRGSAGVFFVLGADYGAADILDFLGLHDVAKDNGITDLRPANAESLVTLDPEIILTMSEGLASTGGIDGLLGRPGLATTTAGKNQRIITAGDTQLLSYGPRTPENLLALAEAIYSDPDASEEE